ncbi:hypothetical protein OEZ85_005334 [Tetradesmus obliquus]|uniref:Uncharacterized protein n=1 Tax=Tetradesmus obliquus TaxID=3088 RepID=A0ABY8UHJ9_TETOB|nr:hypothetical protein OEZ85_005334 [Tetradesmus obliquus]
MYRGRLLNAAAQTGERVAFRVSEKAGIQQATLTVGSKEHHFVGNPVAKQTLLRLTTSEDDNGGVVASITHKLHQRKELHNSDIGAKLRASKANQANSRPQTQMLLDKPVALQQTSGRAGPGHYRSVTPPAASQRASAGWQQQQQQRPSTPPPNLSHGKGSHGNC